MLEYLRETILKYRRIISYLFAGGTAAIVDVGLVYLLTNFVGLWYMTSTVVGFSCGLVVSFFLQKFVTFRDTRRDVLASQALRSFLYMSALNLVANLVLMHFIVEILHVWYLLARVMTAILVAIASYLIYSRIIFKVDSSE